MPGSSRGVALEIMSEPPLFETIDACRSCASKTLKPILALGETALADLLLTKDQLGDEEPRVPLNVAFCPDCTLVQIIETVRPEILFHADYPYFSSVIATLMEHSRRNALELIERRQLGTGSLVVELASNDGYMLQNFAERGIPVLGIDPAKAPALAAIAKGIPTLMEFFGTETAKRLAAEGRHADIIIANNVLAHVANLNGFVAGIAALLKPTGMGVLEFPYLVGLLEHCEFDTIYHQHLCYFSLMAIDKLFRRHGLFVNDVRKLAIHGGSLRIYVEPSEAVGPAVREMLDDERARGLDTLAAYQAFRDRVRKIREDLNALIARLKGEGRRIVAYGAAAKGTTMLAYCGLDANTIEYVVDKNQFKQGRYMPGSRLPIVAPERLLEDRPDYVLLLPWNFADEILEQQAAFRALGGKFIIPVPSPRVV